MLRLCCILYLKLRLRLKKIISKGLSDGHCKMSSKKGRPPYQIFFDLELGLFVSITHKKENYIELRYFTEGKLLLPVCAGTIVKIDTNK